MKQRDLLGSFAHEVHEAQVQMNWMGKVENCDKWFYYHLGKAKALFELINTFYPKGADRVTYNDSLNKLVEMEKHLLLNYPTESK